jgi:hypothetical protein
MVANRCPAKLTLSKILDETIPLLATAIAATVSLEELQLTVQSLSRDAVIFDAIGRNQSIRDLTVVTEGPLVDASETEFFWESVSKSSSIQSVHTRAQNEFLHPIIYDDDVRRRCAELVAKHLRDNQRITRLKCSPDTHDAQIMESQVAPIVRLNRFRPVVKGLWNGSGGGEGRARRVSAVLSSPLVRRHPELLYFLLKANGDILLPSPPTPVVVVEQEATETQDPVALATMRFLVDRLIARERLQTALSFDGRFTRMTRPTLPGLTESRFYALLQARIESEEGDAEKTTQQPAEEQNAHKEALPQLQKAQSEQEAEIVEATACRQTEQIGRLPGALFRVDVRVAATEETHDESRSNGLDLVLANHETKE